MRETYPLTDESRQVLSRDTKKLAEEWDKNPSYIYQILSDATTDPFAKFKSVYAAAVRAGVDVTEWDASLTEIKSRYRATHHQPSMNIELANKITLDSATDSMVLTAMADGVITDREANAIRLAIARERNSLGALEQAVTPSEVTDLPTWTKQTVKAYRRANR